MELQQVDRYPRFVSKPGKECTVSTGHLDLQSCHCTWVTIPQHPHALTQKQYVLTRPPTFPTLVILEYTDPNVRP